MTYAHTMKAAVLERHDGPFRHADIARPTAGPGQVLVQIKASGVNPLDLKIRAGKADHARQPLPAILGIDMAGVVESVGEGVTAWRPGDEVYGMTGGVGGANYQVPVEVRPVRRMALSMRWLREAANKRSEKSMPQRLGGELIEAAEGRGGAMKKRDEVHRMAEANKAFSHFRF